MILTDSTIWISHLRKPNSQLSNLLTEGRILIHPFVIGEIALGSIANRTRFLQSLSMLPQISVVTDNEVLDFISRHQLFGLGIGYIDAHLLVGAYTNPGTLLWSDDKRLNAIAMKFSLAFRPE